MSDNEFDSLLGVSGEDKEPSTPSKPAPRKFSNLAESSSDEDSSANEVKDHNLEEENKEDNNGVDKPKTVHKKELVATLFEGDELSEGSEEVEFDSSSDSDDNQAQSRKRLVVKTDSDKPVVKKKRQTPLDHMVSNDENSDSSSHHREVPQAPIERIEMTCYEYPAPDRANDIYYVRLPNILSIQPEEFEPDAYDGTDITDKRSDNIIRWRNKVDPENFGRKTLESNARFVRWSDGSMHLVVGGEYLNVQIQKLYDHHQAFVEQPERKDDTWQYQCSLDSKMVFTPSSLASKSHAKLRAKLRKTVRKKREAISFVATMEPEKMKAQLEEREAESNKQNTKRRETTRRQMKHDLEADHGHHNDYGHGVDIDRLKYDYRSGRGYDPDEEYVNEQRLERAKKRRHEPRIIEEDDDVDLFDDSDSSDDSEGVLRPSKRRRTQM